MLVVSGCLPWTILGAGTWAARQPGSKDRLLPSDDDPRSLGARVPFLEKGVACT